jgi:hypothetical protein
MKCDKYIVKPIDRIVVGIKEWRRADSVMDEIRCKIGNKKAYWIWPIINFFDNSCPDSIKGVAVCLPEDNFSVDVGKNIVNTKIDYKYHLSMYKKYDQIERILDDIKGSITELKDKHEKSFKKIGRKLDRFVNEGKMGGS